MDSKPNWVADWIWEEYLTFRNTHWKDASEPIVIAPCLLDIRCKCIWSAIDSRRYTRKPSKFARVAPEGAINALTIAVQGFSHGVPYYLSFSASERRRKGTALAKSARRLRDTFLSLPPIPLTMEASYKAPPDPEMEGAFNVLADLFAREDLASDDELKEHDFSNLRRGALGAMYRLDLILGTVAEAADRWAKTKPPITQFGNSNADRLYFVRRMTEFFKEEYGTPLRDQVAALTCVIFDCDIDKETVAKLAP